MSASSSGVWKIAAPHSSSSESVKNWQRYGGYAGFGYSPTSPELFDISCAVVISGLPSHPVTSATGASISMRPSSWRARSTPAAIILLDDAMREMRSAENSPQ